MLACLVGLEAQTPTSPFPYPNNVSTTSVEESQSLHNHFGLERHMGLRKSHGLDTESLRNSQGHFSNDGLPDLNNGTKQEITYPNPSRVKN